MQPLAGHAKWQKYYDRSVPPWDTLRPSSQLRHYLSQCVADLPKSSVGPGRVVPDLIVSHLQPPETGGWHVCPRCAHLKPPHQGTAMELACGSGASAVLLADAARMRIVGVDIVSEAVAAARASAELHGVASRCAFLCEDVFALPEPTFLFSQLPDVQQQQQQQQQQSSLVPILLPSFPLTSMTEDQQHVPVTSTSGAASAGPATPAAAAFDFCYDCQAYHALRDVDEDAYLALLRRSIKRGGLLCLLVGRAGTPPDGGTSGAGTEDAPVARHHPPHSAPLPLAAVGPALLTEQQLRTAFPEDAWEFLWLLPTRFDATPHYLQQECLPAAWWALLRRL